MGIRQVALAFIWPFLSLSTIIQQTIDEERWGKRRREIKWYHRDITRRESMQVPSKVDLVQKILYVFTIAFSSFN
jgi:hypothetical protein